MYDDMLCVSQRAKAFRELTYKAAFAGHIQKESKITERNIMKSWFWYLGTRIIESVSEFTVGFSVQLFLYAALNANSPRCTFLF